MNFTREEYALYRTLAFKRLKGGAIQVRVGAVAPSMDQLRYWLAPHHEMNDFRLVLSRDMEVQHVVPNRTHTAYFKLVPNAIDLAKIEDEHRAEAHYRATGERYVAPGPTLATDPHPMTAAEVQRAYRRAMATKSLLSARAKAQASQRRAEADGAAVLAAEAALAAI